MQRTCTSPTSYWPENGLPISSWSSTNPTMPLSRPSAVSASQLDATLGSSQSRKSCSLMRPLEATERLMLRGKLLSCFSVSVSPPFLPARRPHVRSALYSPSRTRSCMAGIGEDATNNNNPVSVRVRGVRPAPADPPPHRARAAGKKGIRGGRGGPPGAGGAGGRAGRPHRLLEWQTLPRNVPRGACCVHTRPAEIIFV